MDTQTTFLAKWAEAVNTTLGFFWMALWAFVLGYLISGVIQVFVTRDKMQGVMGNDSKGVLLGSFFGFISSSCSFSALATTKALFQKGASFVASMAFLLASTNLVIELGIIISIFLGWQFVVGEYVGGILLILISWLLIKLINPSKLIKSSREKLGEEDMHMNKQQVSVWDKLISLDSWTMVGRKYVMEWKMVWKDVTVGFTIAGIVAAFMPDSFFQTLFINTGDGQNDYSFWVLLEHVIVGPLAAFMTFIGSMGNIPLAALLYGKGVSFAGVMAFIFSDLVVFPVLRINAKYYGWKMSLFILFLLFSSLVGASLLLHYGLDAMTLLPEVTGEMITEKEFFKVNYTFFLNIAFILISVVLVYLGFFRKSNVEIHHHNMASKSKVLEKVLKLLAFISYAWLLGGVFLIVS